MKREPAVTQFYSQVSRFLLLFGGFWVLFTGAVMVVIEGRTYLQSPQSAVLPVVSLFYVARVFGRFYADVKRKIDDPSYQFVGKWSEFLMDLGVLSILAYFQFQSVFAADDGHITVSQFNAVSNVFLSLMFHFFRFVYHLTVSEKKIGETHF